MSLGELLRPLVPRVLAALTRRHGRFDLAEDAVQEALLAAVERWPEDGVPRDPEAWLVRVASRRLIDALRAEAAAHRREAAAEPVAPARDDTLALLLLCCHPDLTPASQVALTLRAVGGLTTAEIARAFLVPEATMAQRISRAKQRLRGEPFAPGALGDERLASVLRVLYLIFTEGHTATTGAALQRPELTREAIRLARVLRALRPGDGEAAGLLALMLLTDARRAARTRTGGELVPLAEQDRGLWDRAAIAEGAALIEDALARHRAGPYQLQAAIAAVHAEAARAEDTDWPQIAALYALLADLEPSPMVTLNRAVAVAMTEGPRAGLAMLDGLDALARHHRLHAVRAHLLERAGEHGAAREAYRTAARLTTSVPEQRYLNARARDA